ncbi:P-loop ATPase, Sll1717 family [Klebsiella variicola]|uniref:P-loop ATPase, Sll1717 family n=1 Tax=Klebsiella variicola TaxID=244366 RepID=UPI002B05FB62|nr:hypothetical protein [Klebsiella variicola]
MEFNITSKSNPFGDTTAENDKKMLSSAFIETADFRTLIETDDRTIVVGRRGTGKSALFIQLNEHWKKDKKILILSFSPDDTQIIGFRSMLKPFTGSFNLARAATRLLWRYAMLMEIASYISSHYKLSSQISTETLLNEHLKILQLNSAPDLKGSAAPLLLYLTVCGDQPPLLKQCEPLPFSKERKKTD